MDPITIITTVSAAMSLIESLVGEIRKMHLAGEITADEQTRLLARYHALKQSGDAAFSGPEWEVKAE